MVSVYGGHPGISVFDSGVRDPQNAIPGSEILVRRARFSVQKSVKKWENRVQMRVWHEKMPIFPVENQTFTRPEGLAGIAFRGV
jgi:hypothetical protein